MKRIILLVVILGLGWFFRYPLEGLVISPFIKSSKEEVFVKTFMQTCVQHISNTQTIKSLATSQRWPHVDQEAIEKFKIYADSHPEGWGMPDETYIAISYDNTSYGKAATCMIVKKSLRGFWVVPSLLSKFHFASPDYDSYLNPTTRIRDWVTHNQGKKQRIGIIEYATEPSWVVLVASETLH